MKRNHLSFLMVILIAGIIAINTTSCKDSSEKAPAEKVSKTINKPDEQLLVGNWLRTDARYRILISQVNDNGALAAQYFNPKSINVESAKWEESYGNLKIIIVLRDVNYPGSTYTLNYLPDRDMLAGEYFQAVEGLTFYVEFTCDR